ncbi:MAG: DUF721 domain-containing protein [Candidatus Babeliaceae bacterium]|jgi:hypothetical protein
MTISIKEYLAPYLQETPDNWKADLLRNWRTVVGSLSEKMRLEKIESSLLIIGVYDPHWMQELFLLSRTIIRTINTYLGGSYIIDLRFRLVQKRHVKSFVLKHETFSARRNQMALTYEQQETLKIIKDQELQVLLKNFLHTCAHEYDKK